MFAFHVVHVGGLMHKSHPSLKCCCYQVIVAYFNLFEIFVGCLGDEAYSLQDRSVRAVKDSKSSSLVLEVYHLCLGIV